MKPKCNKPNDVPCLAHVHGCTVPYTVCPYAEYAEKVDYSEIHYINLQIHFLKKRLEEIGRMPHDRLDELRATNLLLHKAGAIV